MTTSNATKRLSVISISGKMKIPPRKPEAWFGSRHVQVILMALGFLSCYAIRVTMSVALEAMTDSSKANPDYQAFEWSTSDKGVIMSSFFWGYVCTQIPGSMIAHRWGAQRLFAVALGICGLVTLSVPLAAMYGGWQAVCASRVIAGLCQGTVLPCLHTLLAKWSPVDERGTLGTFVYSGGWIGNVLSLLSSGLLAASQFGWPSCFYFWGGFTFVCAVIFYFFGKESPSQHPTIPHDEKEYIEISLGIAETSEGLATPWKAILTSLPMWALLCAQSAQNWGFWMLLTSIPSYMASILHYNIKDNGLISSLPYLSAWLLSFPISYFSDLLIKRNVVSTQASRKICNTIGQWIPAVALIGLGYVNQDHRELAVAILIIAVSINITVYCGHNVNHMDLSPNFAGALMGITNSAANICSILAPLVASVVITDPTNILQWRSIFFLSSGIYVLGNFMFILFGTAQIQKWNDPIEPMNDTPMYPVPKISVGNVQHLETIKDVEKADVDRNS